MLITSKYTVYLRDEVIIYLFLLILGTGIPWVSDHPLPSCVYEISFNTTPSGFLTVYVFHISLLTSYRRFHPNFSLLVKNLFYCPTHSEFPTVRTLEYGPLVTLPLITTSELYPTFNVRFGGFISFHGTQKEVHWQR